MRPTTVTVSVIIPAYDAAGFIAKTIQSVLAQTFPSYEIIVVNDGSPDTPELERALEPYREQIVYLQQPNTGPGGARNLGIRHARGEYVAFLDSDDLWAPEFLATNMQILQADPQLDLLYSNGVIIGDVPTAGRDLMSLAPSRGRITFERLITGECSVLTSCVVARRQSLIDAGLFDERFRRSEDFHLWARLAYRGARIACHRAVLVQHRRRPGSLSHDRPTMWAAAISALEDLEATLPLTVAQQRLVRRHIARCHAYIALEEAKRSLMTGAYDRTRELLRRSREWEPSRLARVRLSLVQAGLLVAPRLLRAIYRMLRRDASLPPAG